MYVSCSSDKSPDERISDHITKAILPCAGYSTRLSGLVGTCKTKLLLPLHGRPLVQYVLNELVALKICDVALVISEQTLELQQHIGNGSTFGLHIHYLIQPYHDGPGGAILAAEQWIDGKIFVTALPDTINLMPSTVFKHMNTPLLALACKRIITGSAEIAYCCQDTLSNQKGAGIHPLGRWVFQPQFLDVLKHTSPDCGGEIRIPDAAHLAKAKGLTISCCLAHRSIRSVNINTDEDYFEAQSLMARGYIPALV